MITVTNVLKIAAIFLFIFFKNVRKANVKKAYYFLISMCDHICVDTKRIQYSNCFHFHA